jgi:hypothetical protein
MLHKDFLSATFIIIIIYLECKCVLPSFRGTTRHSTQSYINSKGHSTHNEYKAIPVTGRGGL